MEEEQKKRIEEIIKLESNRTVNESINYRFRYPGRRVNFKLPIHQIQNRIQKELNVKSTIRKQGNQWIISIEGDEEITIN